MEDSGTKISSIAGSPKLTSLVILKTAGKTKRKDRIADSVAALKSGATANDPTGLFSLTTVIHDFLKKS